VEEHVYIVPNFISEGFYTREVIPRELELTGATTEKDGHTLYYCDPVGMHASMTDLLVQSATNTLGPDIPQSEASLIIVGHGTERNAKSAEAIHYQVDLLQKLDMEFTEVIPAFMEQAPLITDWRTLCSGTHVVVVPYFISDGLHSYQDIPVMLGIESEPTAAASERSVFRNNPTVLDGRSLYYTAAIGTEPGLVEVILDQAKAFKGNE